MKIRISRSNKYFFLRILKRIKAFPAYLKYIVFVFVIVLLLGIPLVLLEITRLDQIGYRSDYHLCPTFKFLDDLPRLSDVFYLPLMWRKSDLPEYELRVDPITLKKVLSTIPACFSCDGPPSSIRIPARFTAEGKTYDVDIALRGLCGDHWLKSKKSWKVLFPEENTFQGKSRIDLITPISRGFLTVELAQYRARKLGLITADSRFVNVKINGKNQGVYWEIEELNKDVLEKNGVSSDVNLYRNEQLHDNLYKDITFWGKKATNPADKVNNFAELENLLNLLNTATDEEFNQKIPTLLNMDNFYRWHIHEKLFGDYHQNYYNNAALYFDRTSGKFNFIPEDVSIEPTRFNFFALFSMPGLDSAVDRDYNPLVTRVLKNEEFVHARNKILWDYVKDDVYLEDELIYFENLYQKVRWATYRDGIKTFSNLYYDLYKHFIQKKISAFHTAIEQTLKMNGDPSLKIIYPRISSEPPYLKNMINLDITIDNFSGIRLKELKISEFENQKLPAKVCLYLDSDDNGIYTSTDKLISCKENNQDEQQINFEDLNLDFLAQREISEEKPQINFLVPTFPPINIIPTTHRMFLKIEESNNLKPVDTIKRVSIKAENAISGQKAKVKISFVDQNPVEGVNRSIQSLDDFIKENPSFKKASFEGILLPSGIHTFTQDVIVPQNLTLKIQEKNVLKFDPGVSLISYSPIIATGTPASPIQFTANSKENWGVVGIINTEDKRSYFTHTYFEKGKDASINGVYLSGQLSSYHSSIEIKYSSFSQASADDSVNIKNSNSLIENCMFRDNPFDALDLDFSANSKVLYSIFENNGNDGLDISGGAPFVFGNKISKSKDKGISLGEATNAVIINNLIKDSQIGLAIKDSSKVTLSNNTVINNETGFDLYQKKIIFKGGEAQIYNSILWGNKVGIKLDGLSTINFEDSNVQGGFEGRNNFNEDPKLNKFFQTTNSNLRASPEVTLKYCPECQVPNPLFMGIF